MQYVMRGTGVLVTVGLIAVSLMMNFRFGQSLGRTEWDGLVYGMASACADGFKVILPFAIAGAWRSRRLLGAFVGACLWLVFTTYSMTSSLGHSAVNRSEVSGNRRHEIAAYQDLHASLEGKQKERISLGSARPSDAIEADLKVAEQKPLWRWSNGCTAATNRDLRAFCEGVLRLQGELALAKRAQALDADMDTLRTKIAALSSAAAGSEADPQVAILRDLSGIGGERVRVALTILVSLMVELGSGLGLFVILGQKAAQVTPTKAGQLTTVAAKTEATELPLLMPPSSELVWRQERLVDEADGHETEFAVYRDYCIWIVRGNRGPALTLTEFRDWIARERVGLPSRKSGRNYYTGIKLRAGESSDARDASTGRAIRPLPAAASC